MNTWLEFTCRSLKLHRGSWLFSTSHQLVQVQQEEEESEETPANEQVRVTESLLPR